MKKMQSILKTLPLRGQGLAIHIGMRVISEIDFGKANLLMNVLGRLLFLYYCSRCRIYLIVRQFFDGRRVSGSTPSPHLDCVVDLDCQVARIITALEKNNILQNTLLYL